MSTKALNTFKKRRYCMLNLHGVLMKMYNKGVLLMGEPASGKSENALALLTRGHQLIADDSPLFFKDAEKWVGKASPAQQGLLCVRALGLLDVAQLFGEQALENEIALELIIYLEITIQEVAPQKLELELVNKFFDNVAIPSLTLPIATSHNVAILIETAVKLAFMPKSARIEQIFT
jgi:HPr kinase/phosphorylase